MRKILLLLFILSSISLFSQKRVYNTHRYDSESPKIDGIIDEEAWNSVGWAGDFTQWEPANGAPPSQNTEFKIIYDDNYLYVAIRAFDSVPEEIVKRMSRRDGFEGDFVEINIDSYHDYLTAFSFSATVAGVKGDERITQDGFNWDKTWDPIWYLKTSIDEQGWIAEIKIPLSQLRFSKDSVQVWGLEVKRRIYREDERSVWQAIDNTEQGYVSRFGELHGIENLKPKKQFDVTPYMVGSYEHYKQEDGSPFYPGDEWSARGGVDAKIGLTNNITMDLSINPDFG
ncbi:MAG: hydrolase, partial [Bacteroidales bacterium]|nr:hydrolase [Bacteroidales bacterium]